MEQYPERKPIRLKDYDYSTPGAYFITVCIADRKPILWNVGAATAGVRTPLAVRSLTSCTSPSRKTAADNKQIKNPELKRVRDFPFKASPLR